MGERHVGRQAQDRLQSPTFVQTLAHLHSQADRSIVLRLAEGEEVCVNELARQLGWLQPQVSRNLHCLQQMGWVEFDQDGKRRIYRLAKGIRIRRDGDRLHIEVPSADTAVLHLDLPIRSRRLESEPPK